MSIFQLIAYGAQDVYLTARRGRRFDIGEKVNWKNYIRYIQESLFEEISTKLRPCEDFFNTEAYYWALEQWKKENVCIRLILRSKFLKETGVRWKQIDSAVFKHLEFREMPDSYLEIYDMRDEDLRSYIQTYKHKVLRSSLINLINEEPVVAADVKHILLYQIEQYLAHGKALTMNLVGTGSYENIKMLKHECEEDHQKDIQRQQKQQQKQQQRQQKEILKRRR